MNKSKNRNIYLNRKMLRESCNSGSLFMSGGRWSFVSGQQCLPGCSEGEYKKNLNYLMNLLE